MNRRITVLTVCALLFTLCFSAHAQEPKKIARIGYLSAFEPGTESTRSELFRQALRERGYVEGKNIAIEYRYAEGKQDRYPELAAELVRLKVDIILVSGGAGLVLGAKNATKTIPIVMAVSSIDPVERGLVESLARPGGNVTGFSSLSRELGGKRLELLKEAVTNLTRVAVLYSIGTPGITRELKEDLPRVARTLKLNVQPWGIRDLDDLEKVFASFTTQHPDGLYAPIAGAVMTANQKRIADFSLKNRLPSMYSNSLAVNDGGLMSYAADESERYRRVAYFIDKILKGAKPADLPVEQPKKFEFIVNLKAAKQIGLTIPPNVLVRADRVIK